MKWFDGSHDLKSLFACVFLHEALSLRKPCHTNDKASRKVLSTIWADWVGVSCKHSTIYNGVRRTSFASWRGTQTLLLGYTVSVFRISVETWYLLKFSKKADPCCKSKSKSIIIYELVIVAWAILYVFAYTIYPGCSFLPSVNLLLLLANES